MAVTGTYVLHKLEDLSQLVLADDTILYGEKTPYTALADAGKIPMSLLDARYLLLTGGTMTGTLNMGDNLIANVEQITFNQAPGTSPGVGEVQWNPTDGTIEVGLLGGIVVWQGGQEQHIYASNETGSDIPNGKTVTVLGAFSGKPSIVLTNIPFGNPIDLSIGVTTESIDDGEFGYVTTSGLARNLDTHLWGLGAFIWADPTTPGDLTDVRPTAPDRPVFIGTVVVSDASDGVILVEPFNIPNLSFLGDVYIPSPIDKDVLRWSSANSRWEASPQLPNIMSEMVTTQGLGGGADVYAFGFYEFAAADVTLTNASLTQPFGTALVTHAAHAFAVFGGAGTVDTGVVGLRVNGTSITDDGVKVDVDSEILSADITALSLNEYLETIKKWLGTVTYELYTVSGSPTAYSLDFNYGLTKYNDWFNIDFEITSIEAVGFGGATDTAFNVFLIHHEAAHWVYAASGFTPITAGHIIASLVGDHGINDQLRKSEHFAWKRDNLSQFVDGGDSEGFMVLVSTSANNSVEYCNIHVGAVI